MKRKILIYTLLPALGLGFIGVNAAAAMSWGSFNGLDPEQAAARQEAAFQNQADILGISVEEIKDAWAEGKNMKQLMDEKGISREEVRARMKDQRLSQLKSQTQTLVEKGVISQTQADKRLQAMQGRIENGADKSKSGMKEWRGKGLN